MRIIWLFANHTILDPLFDIQQAKSIGSSWGGWQTWKSCQTDNVICHDYDKAADLVANNFHTLCNFYIPESASRDIGQVSGVRVYGGDFLHEVMNQEEIVSMHIGSTISDIVLLYGFNWEFAQSPSSFEQQRIDNYIGLVREVIKSSDSVQWVIIDSTVPEFLADLSNVTADTMVNVTKLLSS